MIRRFRHWNGSWRELWAGISSSFRMAWSAGPLHLLGYGLSAVLAGLVPVGTVWLTKLVLDRLMRGNAPLGTLVLLAAGLASCTVVVALTAEFNRYLGAEISRRICLLGREQLYTGLDRLTGLARLEDPVFRDRLRMAEQHSDSGPRIIVETAIGGFQGLLTAVGLLITLLTLSPAMAVVVLVGAVPALVAEIRLSRRHAGLAMGLSPVDRREFFYRHLMTDLQAAQESRLLGLSRLFRRRMLSELGRSQAARRRLDQRDLVIQGLLSTLGAVVAGIGLAWAVLEAHSHQLTVGDIAIVVAAIGGVQSALLGLVARVGTAYQVLLLFDHFQAIAGSEPDLAVADDPVAVPELRHGIELRDVWFRYSPDHPWVLRGVNLFIPCGQSLALVGHNGAGKSTIVKLLCRFYDPTEGAVLWDGIDLRDVDVVALRRRLATVLQDFMCYELSAHENIALGTVDGADALTADIESEVRAAAAKAGIDDVLESLPRAYDTLLSRMFVDQQDKEDPATGVLLSGGQWQRVALARAFLRDQRDLLILDEPTAGLDPEAEHEIHTGITRHRAGRTSVLISHRLGAIRDADRIAVLVDGRVAELGTHEALFAADGRYARMFRVQAKNYVGAGD